MGYNIDTCKVKKIENFRIPISELMGIDYAERDDYDDGTTSIIGCEGDGLIGKIEGGDLIVNKFDVGGEGSGRFMDSLEKVFKKSVGTLIVSFVWEGGDSINQLRVVDGKVEYINIEI